MITVEIRRLHSMTQVEGTDRLSMSEPTAGSIWVLPAAIGYWLVSDLDGPILGCLFRL
jgi:hypothetical protein